MRGIIDRIRALEGRDGILPISLVHGFMAADVAELGVKLVVVTDGRQAEGIDADVEVLETVRDAVQSFGESVVPLDTATASCGGRSGRCARTLMASSSPRRYVPAICVPLSGTLWRPATATTILKLGNRLLSSWPASEVWREGEAGLAVGDQ